MSLNDDNRSLLVKMQMEKSRNEMLTAELLMRENLPSAAIGRLYYAVFHAVTALLIHDSIQVKSHKGAYIQFCLHYVNTGKVSQRYGKWYKDLEDMREESDYNCFYDVTVEDVQNWMIPSREMIDTIAQMVTEPENNNSHNPKQ